MTSTCNFTVNQQPRYPETTQGQWPEGGWQSVTILKPHNDGRVLFIGNECIILLPEFKTLPKKLSDLKTNHNLKLGRKQNLRKWQIILNILF